MDKLPDTPICHVVVEAHNICLETVVTLLNIRGAPSCVASLGRALENLANTLRKLDFAWHLNEESNIDPGRQDGRQILLSALRGCGRFDKAVLDTLGGHLWRTSTPNLKIFHEGEWIWQEGQVLCLTRQAESYKSVIDRELILAL